MRKSLIILVIMVASFISGKGFTENKQIKLPSPKREGKVSLEEAIDRRQSVREYSSEALTLAEISGVLWAAYGRNRWGKLTSPSAGALYPLIIYLVCGQVEGLSPGCYKYINKSHSLFLSASGDFQSSLYQASSSQPWVKDAPALIIISADYQITTSRYGKRAQTYVDIEVGHVGQNIYLEATALGLGTVAVGAFQNESVKQILGLDAYPVYIMPLGKIK